MLPMYSDDVLQALLDDGRGELVPKKHLDAQGCVHYAGWRFDCRSDPPATGPISASAPPEPLLASKTRTPLRVSDAKTGAGARMLPWVG